jgi:hypothetical protein
MLAYPYFAISSLRQITSSPNFKKIKSGSLYKFYYGPLTMQKTRKHPGSRQYPNNNKSIFQTRKIYYHEKGSYRRRPRYIYHITRRESDWISTFHNF